MATKYLTEEGESMLRAYMKMYGLDFTFGDLPALIASHRRQREMIATTLASAELAKAREKGRQEAYEEAMKNDYISVDRLRGMTLGEMTDLLKEG